MSDLDVVTPMEDLPEESAADALSMITFLAKRARTLQQRVWLLPTALGITTILGTPLLSTRQASTSCWLMTGTPKAISCTIVHSGAGIKVLTSQGVPVHGPVTGSFIGRSAAIWSIGNLPWFWVIGVAASVLLSVLCQRSIGRLRTFTVTYLIAGLIGIFVLLASDQLGLPSQVFHLLAIALIICIAGFAARSQALALVAALSFFVGIALSRRSSEFFAQLNIWIPPHSISYLAAGLVLVIGSMILYWRRRPQDILLGYQGELGEVNYGVPNCFDQHKGE
ncbi:MAG: hypothetical protein M0Z39_08330 [Actinomycetota bacterium]|nr:hypothetical protein [Actinomycetota bacterium]